MKSDCYSTHENGVEKNSNLLKHCQNSLFVTLIKKIFKLRWALFVTYTIIQSIMRSEMCSLHLTHPSGAVGSRHFSARGAVGGSVPCSRVSPQSWTLPARAGIRTHNLGLPLVSSPTLYLLGHDCPVIKGIAHPKMKIFRKCTQLQAIQDIEQFVSSSQQI